MFLIAAKLTAASNKSVPWRCLSTDLALRLISMVQLPGTPQVEGRSLMQPNCVLRHVRHVAQGMPCSRVRVLRMSLMRPIGSCSLVWRLSDNCIDVPIACLPRYCGIEREAISRTRMV